MALFNNFAPTPLVQPRFRAFNGDWIDRTKLAISGQNPDGSSNVWGSVVEKALSPVLSIVGGYYLGPSGAILGNKVGQLANKGLDLWSEKITAGTDTNIQSKATNQAESQNDALINLLGSVAGSVGSAAASSGLFSSSKAPIDSGFTTSAAGKSFDSMIRGQGAKLSGFTGQVGGATTAATNGFGSAAANALTKPSFLDALMNNSGQNQSNQNAILNNAVNLLGQFSQNQSQNMINPANAGQFQMNNMAQTSSILERPSDNSNITWLDDKKKNTQVGQSTLPSPIYGNNVNGYPSLNGFADGGVSVGDAPVKIYDKKDKRSEDYFMISIAESQKKGIDKELAELAFGAARFGERVFDQESNLKQESIMKSNLSAEEKKKLLGDHIFEELLTHRDFQKGKVNLATGGKVSYKTQSSAKSGVKEFQSAYNDWATGRGLPKIAVDGTYGPQTSAAVTNWNASNPAREIFVDAIPGGKGVKAIRDLTLEPMFWPKSYPGRDFADAIRGYDEKGNPVMAEPPATFAGGQTRLGGTNALAGDALARVNAGTSAVATGATPLAGNVAATNPTSETDASLTPFQRQNLFGNLADVATAGIGAVVAANNPIPRYQPTAEYTRMFGDVVANRNQGFTAAEQSAINQGLQNSYASNVNAIRQTAGGGASQGAVLGALGRASSVLDQGYLNSALQDAQLRRNNFQNYQRTVMNDLALDQNIFAQDQQAALAQRSAGVQMLDSGLQNIADRQQFNAQYGPGTLYDQLQQAQLAGTQRQNQLAETYPMIYANALREQLSKKQPTTTI